VDTCANCAHCDTSQQTDSKILAGVCTCAGWAFNGRFVFRWMAGCPMHEAVASPQGDGDMGEGGIS
jgi:hypothetical protein